MACCAFVAFLVSQVYVLFQTFARWIRKTPNDPVPSAVMWRLDRAIPASELASQAPRQAEFIAPKAARSKKRTVALVSLALTAELVIMIGGVQWFMVGDGRQSLIGGIERVASVRSFADLKDICTFRR